MRFSSLFLLLSKKIMFLFKKKSNKDNLDIPDFYMVSTEIYTLDLPRKCHPLKRIKIDQHNNYILIKISPTLKFQNKNINKVIIASRWVNYTLFPINKWEQPVYVLYPKQYDIDNLTVINENNVYIVDWANIYKDKESALKAFNNFNNKDM